MTTWDELFAYRQELEKRPGELKAQRKILTSGCQVRYETSVHVGALGVGGGPGNCLAIVYLGGPGAVVSTPQATLANARLIAAAPELLDALKAAEGHLADDLNNTSLHPVGKCPVLVQVRAAIAKAEGR